jgi:hypothetical protein
LRLKGFLTSEYLARISGVKNPTEKPKKPTSAEFDSGTESITVGYMHFTRPRELALAALIGLVAGYLLFISAYASLPPLPSTLGVVLAVLAIFDAGLGFSLRARIRAGRLTSAITASRSVALAKASSLLGALLSGFWLAALIYLIPRSGSVSAARGDLPAAVIGLVGAIILVAAALWLEYCCRTPGWQDPDSGHRKTG